MASLADYLMQQPLYAYGQGVMKQGSQTTPVLSWQEGLARALQGGVGGAFAGQAMRQAQDERDADSKALAGALEKFGKGDVQGATAGLAGRPNLSDTAAQIGMQTGMLGYKQKLEEQQQAADAQRFGFGAPAASVAGSPTPQPQGAPGAAGPYAPAIAGVETGGQANPYQAIGPDTGRGRAHGKYQVMDFNIAPWTKEVLGQELTPQQFLDSAPAQDAVFKAKFGQYLQQTGNPKDAASMWFSGKPLAQAGNVQDVNGTTPQAYVQKFSGALGAGAAPGGSGQSPSAAASGDSVNYQGLALPRAALTTALAIRDHGERQKAILSVVTEAVKAQREGAPVERVRQADGSELIVPRNKAAGMTSAQNVPPPGSKEGDVEVLQRGDPNSPEYAQAYNRQAQPQMSQSGQLLSPDMSAYRPPSGAQPAKPGAQLSDTPVSRFQMSNTLATEFGGNKVVKEYQEVAPIVASMRDAMGRNNKAADLNLVYGIAKLFDPGSVVREGEIHMAKDVQSLPDWVRSTISGWNGGAGLSPVARQRLMDEAESRFSALKAQRDAIAGNFNERAKRYGLNPEDVSGSAVQPQAPQSGAGPASIPVYDLSGKRVR